MKIASGSSKPKEDPPGEGPCVLDSEEEGGQLEQHQSETEEEEQDKELMEKLARMKENGYEGSVPRQWCLEHYDDPDKVMDCSGVWTLSTIQIRSWIRS